MPTLQDQLDLITSTTRELVPDDRMEVSERAIAELFSTGIEDRILPVGARAPQFALLDSNGRVVRSEEMLALGPLVVNFFRGRWCPYCVTEMEAWAHFYPELRAQGALLAAIGPQSEKQSDFMVGQYLFPFPVLSDPGCSVAESFRLAYSVEDPLREHYLSILVNLPSIHGVEGEEGWRLPLPATYLIGQDGTVLFAEAHADFRVRPEPEEVLAMLPTTRR